MATKFIGLSNHSIFSRGLSLLAVLTSLVLLGQNLSAQETGADEDVTYTRHVAPIIQQNCQICHRPASVAPMSFMEYRDCLLYTSDAADE